MIAVQEDAGFALIVEKRSEIYSTYHMPTSFELLLETFLYLLSCIFEICYLILDHLHVDIFSNQKCVLFHIYFHITKFDVSGDLKISRYPIFGYPGSGLFFFVSLCFFFLIILLLCSHLNIIKMQHITVDSI